MSNCDDAVSSPCVRRCCLNEEDICLGCFRSLAEIVHWSEASGDERREILKNTGQRRAAHERKWPRRLMAD